MSVTNGRRDQGRVSDPGVRVYVPRCPLPTSRSPKVDDGLGSLPSTTFGFGDFQGGNGRP